MGTHERPTSTVKMTSGRAPRFTTAVVCILVLAAATEEKSHSGVSGSLDSAPEVRPLDQATQSSGGLDVEPSATRLKSVAPELKNSKTQSPVQELGTGFDKRA